MSRRAWFAWFVIYGAVIGTINAQGLKAAEFGTVHITELGCTNCHAPAATMQFLPQRPAPLLGELGSRVRPEYVRALLKQPHALMPGTSMPDLLHALPEAEREATLDALAHFLFSLGEPANLKVEKPVPAVVEQGKQLYHAVGCVACHQPFEPAPKHKIDPSATVDDDAPPPDTTLHGSVPLPPLARKTNVSALARFLFDPVSVRPAGRMPGMALDLQEAQAIASYLVAREAAPQPPEAAVFTVDAKLAERGREAFATLGCAACHSTSVPSLPEKLDFRLVDAKVEGIDDNENRWPSGETPAHAIDGNPQTKYLNFGKQHSGLQFTLPRALLVSSIALTSANDSPDRDPGSLLLEGSADGVKFVQIAARDVPAFKDRYERQQLKLPSSDAAYRIYRLTFPTMWSASPDAMQVAEVELFTATPPTTPVANKLEAKPLKELRASAADGCIGEMPAARRPKYALTVEQRTAIASAVAELQKTTAPWTAARQVEHAMGAMNCYACHARGDKGGPEAGRNNYFTYAKAIDLGDEGRLPPPLHEVGAKLTAEGFDDMLLAGVPYRTYMATRMPQFGKANVGHLPQLFADADAGKVAAHLPQSSFKLVSEGRKLVGKNTLACINCHAWSGHRLPGAEGLDLTLAPRRLRPEWFYAWTLDPQKLRPRTRMPTAWPEGKSGFPKILNGNTEQQIDAIWAYLTSGTKGGPPQGLSIDDAMVLKPADEPLVFRTFLDGMSAHAILVGHKEGSHAAFDANRVRLVLAWQGDFVSPAAAWEGRAGEYTKLPVKDPLLMPDGPPLAILENADAPWPSDVPKKSGGMIGSSRTPEVWRWRGYRYDSERRVVFLYKAGPVEVEETLTTEYRDTSGVLIRQFRMSAKEDVANVYLIAAAGKTIVARDGSFVVDDRGAVRVSSSAKPELRTSGKREELLVPLAWKDHVAKVTVEYEW